MTSNKPVGRPKTYDITKEKQEQILMFVKEYHSKHNPLPSIRYKDIWEHSLQSYKSGLFPIQTSYDFWKRKDRIGRQIVDLVNTVEKKQLYISTSESIDLINLKELISKYGGKNKDILWEHIEPYDYHLTNFYNKLKILQDDNFNIKKELLNKEQLLKKEKEKNNKLQELLYSLFTYSSKPNELVNLINTGKSKSEVVTLALEKTFDDPLKFMYELNKNYNKTNIRENIEDRALSNLIPLKKEIEYDL